MKWIKKKDPVMGDIKIKHKFLWFPMCINRECRWLEYVSIQYVFEGWNYVDIQLWIPIKFVD